MNDAINPYPFWLKLDQSSDNLRVYRLVYRSCRIAASAPLHSLSMTTTPIAVVTYGVSTQQKVASQCMDDIMADHGDWDSTDLRSLLTDPTSDAQIKFGEDGSHPATVQQVYSQDEFANVILPIAHEIACGVRGAKIAINCHSGMHRADTSGRTLVAVLNAMVDSAGDRMFNAMHFPLVGISKRPAVESAIESACEWVGAPWTVVNDAKDFESRYGHHFCVQRASAFRTFSAIWDWVES